MKFNFVKFKFNFKPSVSYFVKTKMDVHIDDYTFESILGKGTFGYIII